MAAADETYGEAGERLAAKRIELAEAQAALASAKAAMDTDAVMQLQSRVTILGEFIEQLEPKARAELLTEARRRAEKRLLGIRRAHGSIVNELDQDEERVRSLHDELTAAIVRFNDRYEQATALRNEAAALNDRFDLDAELPLAPPAPAARNIPVTLPMLRDVALFIASPATEEHPEMDWRRRTYLEIAGTPGYEIVQLVGPRPWRGLTADEQRIVGIKRERAARDKRAGEKLGGPLALPANTAIGTI